MKMPPRRQVIGVMLPLVLASAALAGIAQNKAPRQGPKPPAKAAAVKAPAVSGAASAKPGGVSTIGVLAVAAGAWLLGGFGGLVLAKRRSPRQASATDSNNLEAVFGSAPVGVALVNGHERIMWSNTALQTMTGYSADTLRDMPLNKLSHLGDLGHDRRLVRELLQGGRNAYQEEKRLASRQGAMVWTTVSGAMLPGGFAGAPAALLYFEDFTRLRAAETALGANRQALQSLYEVVAAEHIDFAAKMRALLELGSKQFNLETGILGKVEGNSIEVKQVVSPDPAIRRGDIYDLGDEPAARGAQSASTGPAGSTSPAGLAGSARTSEAPRPARLPRADLPRDWRNHPSFSHVGNESYLGAAIIVNSQFYGTLNFSGKQPRQEPFTEAQEQLLKLMAQWAGAEIGRRQAQADLEAKQAELVEANTRLEALATQDGLTGVKNRRAFNEHLEREYLRAQRYQTPLSLIILDVDKFKSYNDTYGHPAGDEVLKMVARLLQEAVRTIDFVARYGGEEFVVLLPNTDAAGAMVLGERLRVHLEGGAWPERPVTASFGVATLDGGMTEAAKIISAADRALYHSKESGRNCVTHAEILASLPSAA